MTARSGVSLLTVVENETDPLSFPHPVLPGTIRTTLNQANITDEDLKAMLKVDPLASLDHPPTGKDLDPARFALLLTFAYEKTQQSSDCNRGVCTCTQIKNTFTNSFGTETSTQISNTASHTDSVSASFKSTGTIPSPAGPVSVPSFSAGFSDTNSISFTSSSTTTNSQSNSNSAGVFIACPSVGWMGQNFVDVYWDGVYGSFAFVLRDLVPSEQLLTKEHVPSQVIADSLATGGFPLMPMAHYYYGGQRLPGILDRNGDFRFYGRPINNAPMGHPAGHWQEGSLRSEGFEMNSELFQLRQSPKDELPTVPLSNVGNMQPIYWDRLPCPLFPPDVAIQLRLHFQEVFTR